MKIPSIEILFSSPRKDGKTGLILSELFCSFRKKELNPNVLYLYDMNIEPCIECKVCYDGSDCPIMDDMQNVYKSLEQSDGIVFLTPLFFASLPAKAKAFVDRIQPYYIRRYVLKLARPKVGVGTIIAHSERDKSFASLELTVKYFFSSLAFHFFEPLYFPRFDPANEHWRLLIDRFVNNFVYKLKEVNCE